MLSSHASHSENQATDPSQIFLEILPILESVIHSLCLRFRFSPEYSEDFKANILLWFIEDEYALVRQFRNEAGWRPYLTTLIRHRCRDLFFERHGRWQHSKAATDSGVDAMNLERLWQKDCFSLDEAIEHLARNGSCRRTRGELRGLADSLPQRTPRIRVSEERLLRVPSPSKSDDDLMGAERVASIEQLQSALRRGVEALEPTEQRILEEYYCKGVSLTRLAGRLGICRRKIYTIHARCLRMLRRELEHVDLGIESIDELLDQGLDTEDADSLAIWQ